MCRYVRANADNAFVVGKELRSPALGGRDTLSFQVVKYSWSNIAGQTWAAMAKKSVGAVLLVRCRWCLTGCI